MEEKNKYLYEKNGFLYYRDSKGRMQKHPKNKFEHNEIVTTSSKHYSKKNITRLKEPQYNDKRGWVYIENYINEQGQGGGCGMWNNEDMYEKITDPKFLMIAKRIELKEDIERGKKLLNEMQNSLSKLVFAMDIAIKEDWRKATDSCNQCGALFAGFDGGDPNKDLCSKCLELKIIN